MPDNRHPALTLREQGAGIADLRGAAAACTECDLYRDATQTVFGRGASDATVMLVGEQPGDREDVEGEPFVGPAGALLDKALSQAGLKRQDVYLTNAVKHFKWKEGPPSKPRLHAKPSRYEVGACRPWLEAEIAAVEPAVIVCLGATAAQALLGHDIRITVDRGNRFDLDGRAVVPTFHPAAILRGDAASRKSRMEELIADLKSAAAQITKD